MYFCNQFISHARSKCHIEYAQTLSADAYKKKHEQFDRIFFFFASVKLKAVHRFILRLFVLLFLLLLLLYFVNNKRD